MTEEEEIRWLSKANLSKYIGKYIAIVDNEVVAYGANAKRKHPDKTPSLAKVPKEELLILQQR